MTEDPLGSLSAEVRINESYDAGTTEITLYIFRNDMVVDSYKLDMFETVETTSSRNNWIAKEKQND